MVKVKICGLSRISDIEAVNEEKPDYAGFVFAESRRRVTVFQAAKLREKLNREIASVGVFINEPVENIIDLVKNGVIDYIQLHGTVEEEYIKKLKQLTGNPVIRAIAVGSAGDLQVWNNTSADYLLLDNKNPGSGKAFNWDLIGEINKPFFLAGGISAENVMQAMRKNCPFGVDTSSGVETNGIKDPEKIKEFIRRVRNEY